MKKPVIAVDLDDVLLLQAEGLIAFSNETWGTDLTLEDYDDDLSKVWPLDADEVEARKRLYHEMAVPLLKPVEEAREGMEALAKTRDLIVVTARRETLRVASLETLDRYYEGLIQNVVFAG